MTIGPSSSSASGSSISSPAPARDARRSVALAVRPARRRPGHPWRPRPRPRPRPGRRSPVCGTVGRDASRARARTGRRPRRRSPGRRAAGRTPSRRPTGPARDRRGRPAPAPGRSRWPRRGRSSGRRCAGPGRTGPSSRRTARPSTSRLVRPPGIGGRIRRGSGPLVTGVPAQPPATTSSRIRRPASPRTCRTSSSYLRTTPRVSSTSSGLSSRGPEREQRGGPVERLGHAGHLGQVRLAQPWTKPTIWPARRSGASGTRVEHDLELPLERRVVDPVVQAAPLEGVVDLARPVRGQDHPRVSSARTVPISGTVIWKSDRISSRYASNSSSARSISSISRTGRLAVGATRAPGGAAA